MRPTDLKRLGRGFRARSDAAARRFAESGAARGLADVTYGFAESPFGPLLVATSRRGVLRVDYPGYDVDAVLGELAAEASPRILESAAGTDAIRRQLEEYFEGRRTDFEQPMRILLRLGKENVRQLQNRRDEPFPPAIPAEGTI